MAWTLPYLTRPRRVVSLGDRGDRGGDDAAAAETAAVADAEFLFDFGDSGDESTDGGGAPGVPLEFASFRLQDAMDVPTYDVGRVCSALGVSLQDQTVRVLRDDVAHDGPLGTVRTINGRAMKMYCHMHPNCSLMLNADGRPEQISVELVSL